MLEPDRGICIPWNEAGANAWSIILLQNDSLVKYESGNVKC